MKPAVFKLFGREARAECTGRAGVWLKHEAEKKHQAPSTKHQGSTKRQAPNGRDERAAASEQPRTREQAGAGQAQAEQQVRAGQQVRAEQQAGNRERLQTREHAPASSRVAAKDNSRGLQPTVKHHNIHSRVAAKESRSKSPSAPNVPFVELQVMHPQQGAEFVLERLLPTFAAARLSNTAEAYRGLKPTAIVLRRCAAGEGSCGIRKPAVIRRRSATCTVPLVRRLTVVRRGRHALLTAGRRLTLPNVSLPALFNTFPSPDQNPHQTTNI
jgi:hypothetical protein